ncbi:MAG TPA: hypothetical protein PK926_11155 [Spirochaetota bacterium]|nr:hypothetical protein [Spirochaetota bacterium]HPI90604.1 hypothetical protein [Spirochaetota bacterium]HPR47724.1 hypothetical protein [Spirochaetota bacterium]
MKKTAFLSFILLMLIACKSAPGPVPLGSWDYEILINGVPVGEAEMSTSKKNDTYISVAEMSMKAGAIVNTTKQTIVETTGFAPVKLEIQNRIIHGGITENIDTTAVFKGRTVTLTAGADTSTFTIEKPFVLDGAIYIHEIIRNGFKEGTEISFSVYEPSIETEEPVSLKLKVLGTEMVSVGNTQKELVHITEAIAGIKNINIYIDKQGITHKAVITMLNNRLELVLK